jgi:hypothetical protein
MYLLHSDHWLVARIGWARHEKLHAEIYRWYRVGPILCSLLSRHPSHRLGETRLFRTDEKAPHSMIGKPVDQHLSIKNAPEKPANIIGPLEPY